MSDGGGDGRPAIPRAAEAEGWIAMLRTRADRPPAQPREPLVLDAPGAPVVGSIEPPLARRLVAAGQPLAEAPPGWQLRGAADAALASVAGGLRDQGLGGRGRGELLAVTDAFGRHHAAVERAAVRPLGITTHAVHLVGVSDAGEVWVQQRALDKATDAGLWDTLMGGLVAAGESVADTLRRETDEEAGLDIEALEDVASAGRITIRRPVRDGYMVEHIEFWEGRLPEGLLPANRDGEVARFERLAPAALVEWLRADAFTLEAALILVASLQRRGWLAGG